MSSPELPTSPALATPEQAAELGDLILFELPTKESVEIGHTYPTKTEIQGCSPSKAIAQEMGLSTAARVAVIAASVIGPTGALVETGERHYLTLEGSELVGNRIKTSELAFTLVGNESDALKWSYQRTAAPADRLEVVSQATPVTRALANAILNWVVEVSILNESDG